ncbi:MAG: anhydro-N-acetylmuramic acid kinase, partial [Alphaproteobacteria bacterium]
MSGTSLDGVDAALVRTDGEAVHETGPALTVGYDEGLRGRLREVLGTEEPQSAIAELAREITLIHAESIKCLLE